MKIPLWLQTVDVLVCLLALALLGGTGCMGGVKDGRPKGPPAPLHGEGLEGCTGQAVRLEGTQGGTKTVYVVRCPAMDSMSTTRVEGETTRHDTTLTPAAAPSCPETPATRPGCILLPEVLSQGQSDLYTIKCPKGR